MKKRAKKIKKPAKPGKKTARKSAAKKVVKVAPREKPIGEVTHYFGGIGVAIVKFKKPVRLGAELRFQGATTSFAQAIASMQYDHKPIALAPKGKEIGIKVKKKVREGDYVYAVH